MHTASIAPQSTREAIELIKALEKLPVDAVMIFPPLLFAWGKVGGDLKVKFYEDLVNNTQMPITLFQIPVANYWYDPPTICRIAALKHIVSFEEVSFNVDLSRGDLPQAEGSEFARCASSPATTALSARATSSAPSAR